MTSFWFIVWLAALVPGDGGVSPFLPRDKSFQAVFPNRPQSKTQTIKAANGKLQIVVYFVKPSRGRPGWFVSHSQLISGKETGSTITRLNLAQEAAIDSTSGKLLYAKERNLAKRYKGRELLIASRNGDYMRTRVYIVRQRLFQVFVVGTRQQVSSKAAERFLDSFSLLPKRESGGTP